MSHKQTYSKCKMKNLSVLKRVCEAKGYKFREVSGNVSLGYGNTAKAVAAIKMPDWSREIAVSEDGTISYDHFGSQTSAMKTLGSLAQSYNEEVITEEAWVVDGVQNVYVEESEEEGWKEVVLEF